MPTSPLKLSAIVSLVTVLGLVAIVGGSIYETDRQATGILGDVKDITAADDATARFRALMQKYGKRLKQSEICGPEYCSYELSTANDFISAFRLVPYTEMKTWFELRNGSLVLVMVEYRSALRTAESPVVHVQVDFCPDNCSWFHVHPWGRSSGQLWNGIVEFGSRVKVPERDAALALNTGCLSKLGGCRDISELLPTVWERTSSGRLACRIRTPYDKE